MNAGGGCQLASLFIKTQKKTEMKTKTSSEIPRRVTIHRCRLSTNFGGLIGGLIPLHGDFILVTAL